MAIEIAAEVFSPGEFLRDELEARGWTESEFADILGRPAQAVSEIINGKKEITTDTAIAIGDALGTSAELWLNLQVAYRVSSARAGRTSRSDVARRARMRELVPVRELQKRGWLPDTRDLDVLEASLCDFLSIASIDDTPRIQAAARRSSAGEFTPEQVAWITRVQRIGSSMEVASFDAVKLAELAARLTSQIHDPTDVESLFESLAECGVALVAELPLKSSKIDGVVLFSDTGNAIIGLSTRGDRLDGFLFTLLHEIAHLTRGHVTRGEMQLDEAVDEEAATDREREANDTAAAWMLPREPAFTAKPTMTQIIKEARVLRVHPSVVIGRLQRTGILDWSDFRRSIPKVRPFLPIGGDN